jgi:hypothetical protein
VTSQTPSLDRLCAEPSGVGRADKSALSFPAIGIFRSQDFHFTRHSPAATHEGLELADEQDDGGSDYDDDSGNRYDETPEFLHRWMERVIHLGLFLWSTRVAELFDNVIEHVFHHLGRIFSNYKQKR